MSTTPIIRSYEAKVDDVKPKERAVVSRIGGMDVDRHRTIISHRGISLSSYAKNPIVLHEHGKCPTRGSLPVGRNQWIKIDGDKMIAKTVFKDDPYSIELFNAYKDDWMRGWSINVISHDASPPSEEEMRATPSLRHDCDLIYRSTELVEYSTTSAPSHRDALTILVERGIWVPDEARAEAEKLTSRTTVVMPGTDRAMTDSVGGMASGGAVVDDDGHDDEDKPKKKKPKDDGETTDDEVEKPEGEDDDDTVKRYIREEDGKYIVYSEAGKELGKYDTKEEADKRLGQIEYFKHKDEHGERSAPEPTDAEPVVPDGHGGWLARGFPGVSFPDRAIAEQAVRALANPGRSLGETLAEHDREFERRNAAIKDRLKEEMDRIRADFELREFGIV